MESAKQAEAGLVAIPVTWEKLALHNPNVPENVSANKVAVSGCAQKIVLIVANVVGVAMCALDWGAPCAFA
jgi:hypothetical protein